MSPSLNIWLCSNIIVPGDPQPRLFSVMLPAIYKKKRESQSCCSSHSSKLWHCFCSRNEQRRSPRLYEYTLLYISYPWTSLLLCCLTTSFGTARFRRVKNKASSNAFSYIETLLPTTLSETIQFLQDNPPLSVLPLTVSLPSARRRQSEQYALLDTSSVDMITTDHKSPLQSYIKFSYSSSSFPKKHQNPSSFNRFYGKQSKNSLIKIMGTVLLIDFTRDIRRHNVCVNKQ